MIAAPSAADEAAANLPIVEPSAVPTRSEAMRRAAPVAYRLGCLVAVLSPEERRHVLAIVNDVVGDRAFAEPVG